MDQTIHYLIEYRYWALLVVALFEGPIASFLAGTLVALGVFNFWYALGVLAFKDVFLDTVFYAIGRLAQVPFFENQIRKVRAATHLADRVLTSIESGWREHPVRLMWIGKLAYGLSAWFLVSAGIAGVSFKKFYFYTLPVTAFQFGILMVLGYFLGTAMWHNVQNWWLIATIVLVCAALIFFGIRMFAHRIREKYVEPKRDISAEALAAIQKALNEP